MKLKLLLLIPLSLFLTPIHAQTWEPVGEGIVCDDSLFKATTDIAQDTLYSSVYTMCVYGEKLYAGGLFKTAGKVQVNGIANWDGHKWESLGAGTDGWVTALGIHRNMLIVGGTFNKAGGKLARNIARWLDTLNSKPSWFYFPVGVWKVCYETITDITNKIYFNHTVNAIIDYKRSIYIGGNFSYAENWVGGGCKLSVWDDKIGLWSPVKSLIPNSFDEKQTSTDGSFLIIHNKKLYVIGGSGYFESESSNNILVWDSNTFKKISPSPNFPDVFMHIDCATVSDSGLYFAGGGGFAKGLKTDALVRLNNNGTYKVIDGLPGKSTIYAMICYNNKLYAAGQIDKINGKTFNNIACWDGKQWSPIGNGLSRKKRPTTVVRSLCIYNGYLYAGGNFTCSGDKTVLGIARYKLDGAKPQPGKKKS